MKTLSKINIAIMSMAMLLSLNGFSMTINEVESDLVSCNSVNSLSNSSYRKMKNELLYEGFSITQDDLKKAGLTHYLVNKLPEFIQYKEITIPEFAVIYKYIAGLSYPLYSGLGSNYKEDFRYISKSLCNGLAKMPSYKGITFRNLKDMEGLSKLSVGGIWENKKFINTSITGNKIDTMKIVVEIESLTGKKIRKVTLNDDQFEYTRNDLVVFSPGTRFKVIEKRFRIQNNFDEKELIYIIKEVKQAPLPIIKLSNNTKPLIMAKGKEIGGPIWKFGQKAFDKATESCELIKNDNDILSECQIRCETNKSCSWAVSEWDPNYFEALRYREYQLDVYSRVE